MSRSGLITLVPDREGVKPVTLWTCIFQLEAEKRENTLQAEKLMDELESLWQRLQIDMEERKAFTEKITDEKPSTLKLVNAFEFYIENVLQMKINSKF